MKLFNDRVFFVMFLLTLTGTAFGQTGVAPAAGNGAAGFSGDGGPALSATMNGPTDVATDPKGNLYIADRNNNRVRKVNGSTQIITTASGNGTTGMWYLEGGPATTSILNHPFATVVDGAGNLFIGDFGGFSTVAFTNLYVAETQNTSNSRIHKVDSASGLINQIHPSIPLSGILTFAIDPGGS